MSGTASIGSLVNDQKPDSAAAKVRSRTSQRRRMENVMMCSSISRSILSMGLQELRFERKGITDGNNFARTKPREDFDGGIVTLAKDQRALGKPFFRAHECDLLVAEDLN